MKKAPRTSKKKKEIVSEVIHLLTNKLQIITDNGEQLDAIEAVLIEVAKLKTRIEDKPKNP